VQSPYADDDHAATRKIVVLTLTERCNLKCSYCFQTAKTMKSMPLHVARRIVKREVETSPEFDEIEFDLFGGEPTLCIPLLQGLVEWTESQRFGKPYVFFLDTNGTLVHGAFQKWLTDRKELVRAGLSLDGTPETHNRNRSNSYNRIDVNFFLEHYPEQAVRMTINPPTLATLCADVVHLHELGFRDVIATFAQGVRWDEELLAPTLAVQLAALCEFYLAHPEIAPCSIFELNLLKIDRTEQSHLPWCGSGTSMIAYAADGQSYPCHTFQPNVGPMTKAYESGPLANAESFADPECAGCLLQPICPTCYGINHVQRGDILRRDKSTCWILRYRALAASYLHGHQIIKGDVGLQSSDLSAMIDAIQRIQQQAQ